LFNKETSKKQVKNKDYRKTFYLNISAHFILLPTVSPVV